MYAILIYDVKAKNSNKILKLARKYLYHIQKSVFEGYISQTNLSQLEKEIRALIDKEKDSVRIYILESSKYIKKLDYGAQKEISNIID